MPEAVAQAGLAGGRGDGRVLQAGDGRRGLGDLGCAGRQLRRNKVRRGGLLPALQRLDQLRQPLIGGFRGDRQASDLVGDAPRERRGEQDRGQDDDNAGDC